MTVGRTPEEVAAAERGLRGILAGTLTIEAIVVWLAIPSLVVLGELPGWGAALLGVLGVALVALAGFLRRPWALPAGTALQVLVVLTGLFHPALFVLGGLFLALWLWLLRQRVRLRTGRLPRRAV